MGMYFKPLRRKVGVVTLVLACGFTIGWVRTRFYSEQLSIPVAKNSVVTFVSENAVFAVTLWWRGEVSRPRSDRFQFQSDLRPTQEGTVYYGEALSWGARYQRSDGGGGGHIGCSLPYSIVVVTLTALSAWLLLSKPRTTKPQIIAESKA